MEKTYKIQKPWTLQKKAAVIMAEYNARMNKSTGSFFSKRWCTVLLPPGIQLEEKLCRRNRYILPVLWEPVKSMIPNCLHEVCGFDKIEMDEQIVRGTGNEHSRNFLKKKRGRIFSESGDRTCKKISAMDNIVVSCGGGTVMRQCNVEMR